MIQASIMPDPVSGLPLFLFDAQLSESHEHTNEPTEFPVEIGADVTDHVRDKADEITLTGIVTMTPLSGTLMIQNLDVPRYTPPPLSSVAAAISAAGNAIKDALGGEAGPTVVSIESFPIPLDPVTDAHTILLAIKESKVFCSVITTSHEYSDMVLVHLGVSRTAEEQGWAEFTVKFKHIRTVTSLIVPAPKPLIPAGAPKASGGSQGPKPTDEPTKATVLQKAGEALSGGIKLLGGG